MVEGPSADAQPDIGVLLPYKRNIRFFTDGNPTALFIIVFNKGIAVIFPVSVHIDDPASGAGVPITTGLKRSCSVHARLREKIPQALRGEDDFFHEPEGLGLACTGRTRITFACGYGDSATVCSFFPICFYSVRLQPFIWPFQKEMLSLQVR